MLYVRLPIAVVNNPRVFLLWGMCAGGELIIMLLACNSPVKHQARCGKILNGH